MPYNSHIENGKKSNNPQSQTGGLELVLVDRFQCQKLAESIKRFEFNFDRFDDPLLYPNAESDSSRVALFFFFIVAIDHRTHPKGKIYKGRIDGTELTGAELMYALAMRRFSEDASFFTAERSDKFSA
jgi:hypothetical protein